MDDIERSILIMARRYARVSERIRRLKDERSRLRDAIVSIVGGDKVLEIEDLKITVSKPRSTQMISSQWLREHEPKVYERSLFWCDQPTRVYVSKVKKKGE